jgi:flagellar export protein FliJ
MKKFVYRFESVKKFKESQEKNLSKDLSVIDADLKFIEDEIEKCRNLLLECNTRYNSAGMIRMLNSVDQYKNMLRKKIEFLETDHKVLLGKKEIKIKELCSKKQETQMLESLKEIQIDQFTRLADKEEESALNEISLRKFIKEKSW